MPTYFISDLHLDESRPAITDLFCDFLQKKAISADALYILGDLFEVWIGDDENTILQNRVANALAALANKNVPLYFIHGNRDFLIGKRFAKKANMRLLPQYHKINLYGKAILLMHGDTLCTNDVAYQKFRRKVRNPILQWIFLHTSLNYRKKIAAKYRAGSKKHQQQQQSLDIMDVSQDAVLKVMQQYQVALLIHGHTHRPAIHDLIINQQPAKRIVLADWHEQGNALVYDADHQFELIYTQSD